MPEHDLSWFIFRCFPLGGKKSATKKVIGMRRRKRCFHAAPSKNTCKHFSSFSLRTKVDVYIIAKEASSSKQRVCRKRWSLKLEQKRFTRWREKQKRICNRCAYRVISLNIFSFRLDRPRKSVGSVGKRILYWSPLIIERRRILSRLKLAFRAFIRLVCLWVAVRATMPESVNSRARAAPWTC